LHSSSFILYVVRLAVRVESYIMMILQHSRRGSREAAPGLEEERVPGWGKDERVRGIRYENVENVIPTMGLEPLVS
jgi:hypothetical protein